MRVKIIKEVEKFWSWKWFTGYKWTWIISKAEKQILYTVQSINLVGQMNSS